MTSATSCTPWLKSVIANKRKEKNHDQIWHCRIELTIHWTSETEASITTTPLPNAAGLETVFLGTTFGFVSCPPPADKHSIHAEKDAPLPSPKKIMSLSFFFQIIITECQYHFRKKKTKNSQQSSR